MKKEPLYILTYDHGGYVLWCDRVKPRLKDIALWMEKYPRLKIGLDYEAFTFDEFMRSDPEIVSMIGELLKKYPDRVGLGSTTYGQPLSLYISEESNIRQLSLAVRTNLRYFGTTPDVYSISEFALNSQIPQMIRLCGYKAAILRSHVMGYGYTKTFDVPWGSWVGKDKTEIPAVPTYDGQGRGYNCTTLDNWILSRWPQDTDISLEDFREIFKDFSPLLATRYDDLTQPIEEMTEEIEKHEDYIYVLLEDIPKIFGEPQHKLILSDNDFHSQMPWGYCGNEIFCGCRRGETQAVEAEKLNTLSVLLGGESLQEKTEEAWKYILASQHHDVTICGLLELARRFIPSSLALSEEVKEESLINIERHFAHSDEKALFVMNPHSFPVSTHISLPVEEMLSVDGKASEIKKFSDKMTLEADIALPPLTAKSLSLHKGEKILPESFSEDKEKGILITPFYKVTADSKGIASIIKLSDNEDIFTHKEGKLLSGHINGKDCVFEGEYEIKTNKTTAEIVFRASLDTVPCEFIMTFYRNNPRIDCKLICTVKDTDRIGRTDVTEDRPVPLTVNGHHHHHKLCFTAELNLKNDRRMFRDLPFSIAEWNGQLRKTEEYWYPGDRILVDTPVPPEEAFEGITHLQGVYWVSLRDEKRGLAIMNRGSMGSAVHGNKIYIPLIYSNDYMCGTKILDGEYINEFSLLPFDGSVTNTDIHKQALEYNMPVTGKILKEGKGDISEMTFGSLRGDTGNIILSALYPEDGKIKARMCNFSDAEESVSFSLKGRKICSEEDLLGNSLSLVKDDKLILRGWEIKTVATD